VDLHLIGELISMSHHLKKPLLPFTAIVGQNLMKKALILNAINPSIGGVLIRGEKGTAKSSAVRALTEILPLIKVVPGCPFSCDPDIDDELCELCQEKKGLKTLPAPQERKIRVINLPIGATEDRVVGTIDIEIALKEGIKALEPGILANANRGILYIDEVNLLDDHVVDVLLDAAAMGVNTVEREGISFSHPSRFILIGTMNPEEGELRPQLLDRFGLQVSVEAIDNPDERIAIVLAAEEHLVNPIEFREKYQVLQEQLSIKILNAKHRLKDVIISEDLIRKAVEVCIEMGVKTHRADITIIRTAKTLAAYYGRIAVTRDDLKEAIELALPHRMRKRPFEEPKIDHDRLDNLMDEPDKQETKGEKEQKTNEEHEPQEDKTEQSGQSTDQNSDVRSKPDSSSGGVHEIGSRIPELMNLSDREKTDERYAQGKRFQTSGTDQHGHYMAAWKNPECRDIALDATIRAVAPFQQNRKKDEMAVIIRTDELLQKRRIGKTATACLFLVDASGSMGVEMRMEAAKGAIFSLLENSYQNRDRVGMIAFKGEQADLILPLCSSIDLAYVRLRELPTGGRTPLASGLQKALSTLYNEKIKYPSLLPILILISDGRANVSQNGDLKNDIICFSDELNQMGIKTLVIDTEEQKKGGFGLKLGFCPLIAEHAHGLYFKISDLTAEDLTDIVRTSLPNQMAAI